MTDTPPADKPPEFYSTGERYYPDGRKRPTFLMPVLAPRQRTWHKRDGSTALKRAEAKRKAQEQSNLTARQMAERLDGIDKTATEENDV